MMNRRRNWFMAAALGAALYVGLPAAEERRVVTLGGPATEITFALGAGGEVVATDASSLYPEEAQALPRVGYVAAVGAEGLLGQNPDLILATSRFGPPAVVEQIEASGVPLMIVESPHDVDSLEKAIREIGAALERREAAARLWQRIRADLRTARAKAATAGKPTAVFILGNAGSAMAAGRDTQAAGMLHLAGGRNLFDGYTGYQPVSGEALLDAGPDFIFVGRHGGETDADPRERLEALGLGALAASTDARVHFLDLGEYLVFGPRTGQAALRLAGMFAEGND